MSKVWTYIILNIGLAMLLLAAGITVGDGGILDKVGIVENGTINTSNLALAVGVLLLISAFGSLAIGFFSRSSSDFAFKAPFASANFFIFSSTFVGVIDYFKSSGSETWLVWVISVVFSLLAVGFLISLVEWVFGGDN